MTPTSFDDYAENYDETLAQGLAVSGEDSSYFAKGPCSVAEGLPATIGREASSDLRLWLRHGFDCASLS
jgi:hypothetical protein